MGKKKDAARAALEQRERELAAELEQRAKRKKKDAKRAGKKVKPERPVATTELTATPPAADDTAVSKPSAKARTLAAAAITEAVAGNDETRARAADARAAAEEADTDETDEQIAARVKAKRAAREQLAAAAATVDRADEGAVAAHNEQVMATGGGDLLTSDAERERRDADLAGVKVYVGSVIDELGGPVVAEPAIEARADDAVLEAAGRAVDELRAAVDHVVEQVETEQGREFAVGPAAAETFAKPSEASPADWPTNGRGQYLVRRPSDGKLVGYTRATTYIDNLEDKSALTDWKLRMLLEGVAAVETPDADGRMPEHAVDRIRDLVHVREVTIAKARKADRKGKLEPGELGVLTQRAMGDFKKAADALAEELLELGGANVKREKGTDLHALTEVYDYAKWGEKLEHAAALARVAEQDGVSPADLADVDAYGRACEAAGLRILPEHIEQVIVNDELQVAGRLDRIVMVKRPDGARAIRAVGDVKTGRVDYSQGKNAQQIGLYATGEGYDLESHERTPLRVNQATGVLIHLPAGMATCTIHLVDLTLGRRGVALSGQVREWRRDGRRAYDVKAPMVTVGPGAV